MKTGEHFLRLSRAGQLNRHSPLWPTAGPSLRSAAILTEDGDFSPCFLDPDSANTRRRRAAFVVGYQRGALRLFSPPCGRPESPVQVPTLARV